MTRVWIQGAGEMASGVAVALVRAGCQVVLAERPAPAAVRRRVCFAEAVFRGRTAVEEVPGRLRALPPPGPDPRGGVTVVVDPGGMLLPLFAPHAVVDARMTKRAPRPLAGWTGPVIGLGPGFEVGRDADVVVETHRPAGPGRLITAGSAAPDTGRPGAVGGRTTARVVRAPVAGRFRPAVRIGDLVAEGDVLGHVAGQPVRAGLAGMVRGLVDGAAELSTGEKVGDVDPRGVAVDPDAVSDKARAIGDGVLAALAALGIRRGTDGGRRDRIPGGN